MLSSLTKKPIIAACGAEPCAVDVVYRFEDLPPDARAFLESAEWDNIEFGAMWYSNLVDTVFVGRSGVRFYIQRNAGQVFALLPLYVGSDDGGFSISALANFYTTLYQPLIAQTAVPEDITPLLAALRRDFPRTASLRLAPMDPATHAFGTLMAALRLQGWVAFGFFSFGNWYHPVDCCWAQYLTSREGMLRSTIKRMGKKFSAQGGVLEIVTATSDMPRAIAAYQEVYAASWKKPEPFPRFMPGLLQSCAERGFLRLGLAWLNGKPIAAQAWIVSHGRAAIYKLAYHEDYKVYAPGTLLTALLMERVIDVDQVVEMDYLIGDDDYKKSWMTQRRERWGIIAYNPRTLRGFAGAVRETLGRFVKHWRRRR